MLINQTTRNNLLMFLALIFASLVCTTLVVLRMEYSGSWHYFFLLWNLFLAWLPFLFAWGANRTADNGRPTAARQWSAVGRLRSFVQVGLGGLWLLFFPNAPYLVTDLMHLQPLGNVPLWFDAILLFAFALAGLFLGFLSLYLMQMMVMQRFGRVIGWGFVLAMMGLSSFGVYIGRFLRFNSWDVFTDPFILLRDIAVHLEHPFLFLRTITVSTLLSLILLGAYGMMLSLPLIVEKR